MRSEFLEAWVILLYVASLRLSRKPLFCKLAQNWAALMETSKTSSAMCRTLLHQLPGVALQLVGPGPRVSLCVVPWVKLGKNEAGAYFFLSCSVWRFLGFLLLPISSGPGGHLLYPTLTVGLRESLPADNLHPVPVCLFVLMSVRFL